MKNIVCLYNLLPNSNFAEVRVPWDKCMWELLMQKIRLNLYVKLKWII